jgi:hypothetical protein
MLTTWILPLGIVAAFAALLVAPLVEALLPRVWHRRFRCPWAGEVVDVEFVQRAPYGVFDAPDVAGCSAFEDPAAPACEKGCLNASDTL